MRTSCNPNYCRHLSLLTLTSLSCSTSPTVDTQSMPPNPLVVEDSFRTVSIVMALLKLKDKYNQCTSLALSLKAYNLTVVAL